MWLSVAIATDAGHAEALSDALLEDGALSVSVEDAEAGTEFEMPQFGEPGSPATPLWRLSKLVALFEPGTDLAERIAGAARRIGLDEPPRMAFAEVHEQDWVRLTQSQFEPIRINDRLWIVPSWHVAPDPAAINLELDPGLAFGTGSHPTTRLCLEWLCAKVRRGDTLLDYGCGSGILALAGAKLGAGDVVGVDIDERALEAAAENAARNHVGLRLAHSRQPLSEQFDIVIANILTNPLCVLAPLIATRVKAGGRLALSGVLETQAEQVVAAYAPWVSLAVGAMIEGWVRLEGRRS
ncbi:MAG: 50S ribosomal protein L11 methyltransferase [Rhodocyclaceae bacterium]|nr:50S ribosomal protein L11 methyltransferase [Rhodocyclaceae bacterium]MBK6554359.1 50S ribosomal protein L11 methyltransferase [Rhodocyclaceae bacterium]MBK6677689.1 50S ribosomal protein L11 methyltransferase [Rhodocyclaceae bacterium]MBK9310358.1 50S ribosomal protein L11 methyltransferase [Rhodocyclaceae bacterium]